MLKIKSVTVLHLKYNLSSGGHVNPAVTFGIALAGKIKWLEAGLYIVAQLLGGLVGSLLVRLWLTRESYVSIQGGATLCAANVTMFQVNVALHAEFGSLLQSGGISGASMNPGRSFGPNVVATIFMHEELAENFWSHHWIYYVGPICGAALASGLY
ncbi:unnamed protein product, partial [Nippostrongylus brasiliensis]|uniref:Aquaporin-8 (inferred by orthology to a human protein) n=1 Tax=Nippostrongylus brasiliensis TaxID=27835 RepID=A0A0N4YY09_NIPBR